MTQKFTLTLFLAVVSLLTFGQTTKERLDSIIYSIGDSSTGSERGIKQFYSYNSSGKLIQQESYNWDDSTGTWIPDYTESYVLNNLGNVSELVYMMSNYYTNVLENNSKCTFTYNTNNKVQEETRFDWNDSTNVWDSSAVYQNQYDNNGNLSVKTTNTWDSNTNQWEAISKDFYTYNNNLLMQVTYEYWSDWDSSWVKSSKNEYKYDANGNKIEYQYSSYYSWDSSWTNYSKTEFTYDANGDLNEEIGYYSNVNTSEWTISDKQVYSYNPAIGFNQMILPIVNVYNEGIENVKHQLLGSSIYQYINDSSFSETATMVAYYSTQNVISVNEINTLQATIYPNPATENVTVIVGETASFELYNLQGQLVLSQNVTGTTNVNLSYLNQGVYFYSITSNGSKASGKLVKK